MSDSDSFEGTPPELKKIAESINSELLPQKSKARYEVQYSIFKKWREEKQAKVSSENVLLAYFTELVDKNKKSLWCIYSMLKSCIILYENIYISKYAKLISYLKRKTANHIPKKSKVLEEHDVATFIEQAPDEEFLLMKVILVIGVSGACRREELYKMTLEDIKYKDDILLITIPITKTSTSRTFVISKSTWVELVKKYIEIRKKIEKIKERLFLKYYSGKCVNVPIGINAIGMIPSKIASYLKLENPTEFTGHCFRRSSATLLVNRGGDLLSLKQFGGWKSSTVAEGYVAESLKRKIDVAQMMTEESGASTSKITKMISDVDQVTSRTEVEVEHTDSISNINENKLISGLFSHVQDCSINVNVYNNCVFEKK
ncbi:hypothetical protein RN001_000464 [Aquatica leii]|uniref:Tyr recombinase domain-containing protein n=1 Tax=Aquatica leii TaxID=1421715 RepID=A0AAN7QM17_9COLE|nr:hypothetical protein RN001_000464 [Aquatica leii]